MKNIVVILMIISFISGCDNSFLEKIGLKERVVTVKQERTGVVFVPNENEPFTGKYVEYFPNGNISYEISYVKGIENGIETIWFEGGQKKIRSTFSRWQEKWIDNKLV